MAKKKFLRDPLEYEMYTLPFGMHEGKKLDKVPAGYIIWLVEEGSCPPIVKDYYLENEDDLLEQKAEEDTEYRELTGY